MAVLQVSFYVTKFEINPEIIYIYIFIFFILITLSRFGIVEIYKQTNHENTVDKILIYGAGEAGFKVTQFITNAKILGFIDDNLSLIGKVIGQYRIYSPKNLEKIISDFRINKIIIAIPSLLQNQRKKIIDQLTDYNVTINILPSINDLIQNKSTIFDLDSFRFEDLINRNISWEKDKIYLKLNLKDILITGAGGSIGSELSLQIIKMKPKNLYLIDNSENNLYNLNNLLSQIQIIEKIDTNIHYKLVNITDFEALSLIFKTNIDYVFHAAAYKHVPLLEDNITAAIQNNILGTMNTLELSFINNVNNFTLISSDKAVRPTNIMGVTKRFSEIIAQNYFNKKDNQHTNISIVRFGNVLGSSGSVIPLFLKQLKEGSYLTVTHPEVSRFFMTIEDAVGLVLQSNFMSRGGEIYVLNMGKAIKIDEVAKKLLKLFYGKLSNTDMNSKIKYIGLRPGEKMHEELFIDSNVKSTDHKDITMTSNLLSNAEIEESNFILNDLISNNFINLEDSLIKRLYKIVKAKI